MRIITTIFLSTQIIWGAECKRELQNVFGTTFTMIHIFSDTIHANIENPDFDSGKITFGAHYCIQSLLPELTDELSKLCELNPEFADLKQDLSIKSTPLLKGGFLDYMKPSYILRNNYIEQTWDFLSLCITLNKAVAKKLWPQFMV